MQSDSYPDADLVRSMGWSAFFSPLTSPLGDRWLVFAYRDDQRIMARAVELGDAWRLAAEMVEKLQQMTPM